MSVSAIEITVFVVGSWFLDWRTLIVYHKNFLFCFLKFWFLTYLWPFLDFLKVFLIYSLLILKDSIDQTEGHRDLKFWIYDLYTIRYWTLKSFFIFGKLLPVLWRKPKLLQRRAFGLQLFPFKLIFTLRDSFGKYLTIPWFVNEKFYFLTYLRLFLDFLVYFAIFPLLILKESIGQAKWQRNLGFGTYFFIITYWLQLRLIENLPKQAAIHRIYSKY